MSSAAYIAAAQQTVTPFVPAPRYYLGNMCGVRVLGAPPVDGGADDPSLILSWFYDRYPPKWQAKIREAWDARGDEDVLVSWPDSQRFGYSPQQFTDTCLSLLGYGFRPNVFLSAKPTSSNEVRTVEETLANIMLVLPLLLQKRAIRRMSVAWESNLWLTPHDLQFVIDACVPMAVDGDVKCYTHFSPGVSSWQVDPGTFADFWNKQVGKLSGTYHQKINDQTPDQYRYDSGGLVDVLLRFAGGFNVVPDSGFGHPYDLVALEITAQQQFNGDCTEAQGDELGQWAIDTPEQSGPAGLVRVMGSGNGYLHT